MPVVSVCKLLKLKTFISNKLLDTPLFRLIRFSPESFDGICLPLELFSLEKKRSPCCRAAFLFGQSSFHSFIALQVGYFPQKL